MTSLILHFGGRPPTVNAERYKHWSDQGRVVRQYRTEAAFLASRKPKFDRPVVVTARPICKDNRLADAGACWTVVKAIVDGVVDAGLLPHDGPAWVRRYDLCAPENHGEDLLIITIEEVQGDE